MGSLKNILGMMGVPEKDKAKIRVLYDASSTIYRELYGDEQKKKYSSLSKEYLPALKEVVLDAGCGVGLFVEIIGSKVYYVGIDISLESLYKSPKSILDKVTDYVYCDVEMPPFRRKSFDKVYSFTQIHHSSDPISLINTLISLSKSFTIVSFLKKVYSQLPGICSNAYRIIDSKVDWIVIYKEGKYNRLNQ
jgi:SAM-dependent methyltransferase